MNKTITLSILFLTCIIPNISSTQDNTIETNARNQSIELLATSLIEVSGIPGLSIAVGHKGEVVYNKAFGYADIENNIKMTKTTRLRTASVAKVITATALGKLASEGLIHFDDSIAKYVPYAPDVFKHLTIRQLAGHSAGVEHRGVSSAKKKHHYDSTKTIIELFDKPKTSFAANTNYQYSTAGYNLLAAVIEGASGKSYLSYMNEDVFHPLTMEYTYAENIDAPHKESAQLYNIKNNSPKIEHKWVNGSYKLAGAGFRTTPSDLIKMTHAYFNGMISPEVSVEMFSTNKLNDGTKTGVGIGWRTNRDINNRLVVDHAGGWQGARSVIIYYPEEKLSVSIMINARCGMVIEETAQVIAQLFLNKINRSSTTAFSSDINAKISTDKVESCKGTIKTDNNGTGNIQLTSSKQSLKLLPIFKLPSIDHYAVVSPMGILFMKWPGINNSGKIYLTQSRNTGAFDYDHWLVSFAPIK